MGAMVCNRKGCDAPMCDRYSSEYGYICYDCFAELVRQGPCADIGEFMNTPKKPDRTDEATARYDAVFKKVNR